MASPRPTPVVLVALSLIAVACTSDGEQPSESEPSATEQPDEPQEPDEPEEPEPSLDARWYEDANDDAIPDFIAEQIGEDADADPCAGDPDCPGPGDLSMLEFVERQQNTLLLLDASGSMAGGAGGGDSKMQAAKDALAGYVAGTPELVNLGFVVYGHEGSNDQSDKDESCAGVETLAEPGELDPDGVGSVLEQFEPTGFTPIAGALEEAGEQFASAESDAVNRVILVSDGEETCDGDPVAAAEQLQDADIAVTVDVVGFDVPDDQAQQLQDIADVTGGEYTEASDASEIRDYFRNQVQVVNDLAGQLNCLVEHFNDAFGCESERYRAAMAEMRELEQAAESPEASDEIGEIRDSARQARDERRDLIQAEGDRIQGEVSDQLQEAADRVRNFDGWEQVAWEPCRDVELRLASAHQRPDGSAGWSRGPWRVTMDLGGR